MQQKAELILATKTELKLEQDKIVKLHDLSFLFGKNLFS